MDMEVHLVEVDGKYKCLLCKDSPRIKSRALLHIQQCHVNQGAVFQERTMVLCTKGCHQRGDFHCCCCEKVYVIKKDILTHLKKDLILPVNKRPKVDTVVDVVSDIVEAGTSDTGNKYVECSQCNRKMLRKKLKRHVVRKHTNK